MALIDVRNVSFHYEGSPDMVFENVSFQIDTDWKLGLIGRNGRGKTTFLRLLEGAYPYQGQIAATVRFDYFPYALEAEGKTALEAIRGAIAPFGAWEAEMERLLGMGDEASLLRYSDLQERMIASDGYRIDELIAREAGKLQVDPGALSRPFEELSSGERTKLMIAALFLRKNGFLLIDEPTNHLDIQGRGTLEAYLKSKKGFILVSHDRALLDGVVDHVLSINRADIRVQQGNYTTWKQNKDLQDQYEQEKNERLKGDIRRLEEAGRRNERWSDRIEAGKIGTHAADRGAIGAQSARMMKRAKTMERRVQGAIDEKAALLQNVETAELLKIHPLPYIKKRLLEAVDLSVDYGTGPLFAPVTFELRQGERLSLTGRNGSGKSSILKLLLGQAVPHAGQLLLGSQMIISYVPQETSHLRGPLRPFIQAEGIDETLFKAILRKLDFSREQFEKPMEAYSGGQKKKVLLAASLSQSAHLYVWDEPLNFIDILSREQIEALILAYRPTMVFVEHDRSFAERIATKTLAL